MAWSVPLFFGKGYERDAAGIPSGGSFPAGRGAKRAVTGMARLNLKVHGGGDEAKRLSVYAKKVARCATFSIGCRGGTCLPTRVACRFLRQTSLA